MPRLGRRTLIVLSVLAFLVGGGAIVITAMVPDERLDTVEPGQLRVEPGAVGEWQVGTVDVVLDDDGLTLHEDGRVLWSSDPGTAFVTAGRGEVGWQENAGYFWPSVSYSDVLSTQVVADVTSDDASVAVSGQLTGGGKDAAYTLEIRDRPVGGATIEIDAPGTTSVALVTGRNDGAGVHGFGEQFSDFDVSGRLLPIVAREQGVGRGTQPLTYLADVTNDGAGGTETMSYAAWSSFVTDDVRGVRLDPDEPGSHAFAMADTRHDARVSLELWSSHLSAEVTAADTPADLITTQQASASRPQLTSWATDGAIVGLQGGTDEVRRKVGVLREAGAEIAAVWLQDWTGQRTTSFGERLWWTWQLDQDRYPGWAELVDDLHSHGIRTTTYVNPFLVDASDRPSGRNLFAEARDDGFLVRDADGAPYQLDQGGFDASLVDLTNPDARDWYADVIAEEVLADGVDGFMADFGEGLPFDAELADGDPATAHNQWPSLWASTVREACERAERPDCVTWFRSGSLGQSEDAALFWNGDQLVDFGADDGLASALLGTFSAGVSGWPLIHSDVGGYTSIDAVIKDYVRSPRLLKRWAEYEAFGVVMRTHEGNRPDANAQVYDSADAAEAFARMTQLHSALAPYRRQVVDDATRTGVPALRHGWLVAPGTDAAAVDAQFFLGESLLVAPVLSADADSVEVTFPPGEWEHLLTGERFDGDQTVSVDAPVGTPAAFMPVGDPWLAKLRAQIDAALGG